MALDARVMIAELLVHACDYAVVPTIRLLLEPQGNLVLLGCRDTTVTMVHGVADQLQSRGGRSCDGPRPTIYRTEVNDSFKTGTR